MAAFIDQHGRTQQVEVGLSHIQQASQNSMSVRDWINSNYETDAEAYGDAFSQMCASEGIILRGQRRYGLRAANLDTVLNGRPVLEGGAVVRQPSQQARTLLMPAIGALVEDQLLGDLEMNANAFDSMISLDTTIADDWLLWPVANYAEPEKGRSQVTSQLSKPAKVLTLTTSEKSVKVPTFALGIEWSEQATKYLNLDFISMSIARQLMVERNERADENILAMLNGDTDVGQGALSAIGGKVVTAKSLDSSISTAGTLTQTALMLWLYRNAKKRRITHVVTDIHGALAIENRSGRPTVQTDNNTSPRINVEANVLNPSWQNFGVFITDDPSWPANTLMGIDARYAMQRVTSTNATYQAQEEFVLRRGSAMRWDVGSITRRLYDDAFEVLTLTVA